MTTILFNAFSFLQKKLRDRGLPYSDERLSVSEQTTVSQLIDILQLKPDEVEGVFINGKIGTLETLLKDGDRVALFPPGTPGPHRLLLGIKKNPVAKKDGL